MSGKSVWADAEPAEKPVDMSASAVRMRRKRKREHMARLFWRFYLRTGSRNQLLIQDSLDNAPGIVEAARLEVIHELAEFAEAFPWRAQPVTNGKTKKSDATKGE